MPLDSSLRAAPSSTRERRRRAASISVALALYGTTGVLEAARRALNVVFELDGAGRSFLRRKAIDIAVTFVLMGLVLASLIMVFVGGGFADDLFGFIGLGSDRRRHLERRSLAGRAAGGDAGLRADLLRDARRQAARRSAGSRPGAVVGVLLWLVASVGFSPYIS